MVRILAKEMDAQLVVSEIGNAAVFYRGTLGADYSWAQFDAISGDFQFVRKNGDIDSLGHQLTPAMIDPLKNTNEIFLIQVTDQQTYAKLGIIKFCMLG